jgi:hypothetical protein
VIQRLLIVGATGEGALETAYQAAFQRAGVETEIFEPDAALAGLRGSRVLNRVTWSLQHIPVSMALERRIARGPRPDAVLVVKGYFLSQHCIRACRAQSGVPWLNFNPDSPFDPGRSTSSRHIRAALRDYDLCAIWSRDLVRELSARGVRRAEYLPFAAAKEMHHPSAARDPSLARSLVFVGSYDAQRARVLEALAGLPLVIQGNAWEDLPRRSGLRKHVRSRAVYGAELRRVVSSALASINILRPQNAGAHNMRTFEVPAMGGLMLTTRSAEQQAFFPEGEACLMYDSPAELRQVAERLLRGEYDVPALKAQALARAEGHTYDARARQLLEWIDALRGIV